MARSRLLGLLAASLRVGALQSRRRFQVQSQKLPNVQEPPISRNPQPELVVSGRDHPLVEIAVLLVNLAPPDRLRAYETIFQETGRTEIRPLEAAYRMRSLERLILDPSDQESAYTRVTSGFSSRVCTRISIASARCRSSTLAFVTYLPLAALMPRFHAL